MAPKLTKVIRLDSIRLDNTYYTQEGYLKDRPILTTTGIFEYSDPDGGTRRELRLPEEVFDKDSLASYRGKPIIITHDAGLVSKDNVHENQIGTILSEGFRDGDNVRADIIIHDTDGMKESGLRELSLGYNLDLDETPGVWNGHPYDAIQRNIRVNHLALVREARAGEQARLNIDSRDPILKGGRVNMSNKRTGATHADGLLSPEELQKAIAEYKARRAQAAKTDGDDPAPGDKNLPAADPGAKDEPAIAADGDDTADPAESIEDKVNAVKENQAAKSAAGEPKDVEAAKGIISRQDDDISTLCDIIDTLLAQMDFAKDSAGCADPVAKDCDDGIAKDADDAGEPDAADCSNTDDDDDDIPNRTPGDIPAGEVMNADGIDRIVRDRINLGIVGSQLNMDGLETMGIQAAKKAVIRNVHPGIRLDGKSRTYVDAMFDLVCQDVRKASRKGTDYQIRQMFNQDSANINNEGDSSDAARQRMIERRQNRAKEEK